MWFSRAVIERHESRVPLGYYESGPWLLSGENRRKVEPKPIPSCLIRSLLVGFTLELEILWQPYWINVFIAENATPAEIYLQQE